MTFNSWVNWQRRPHNSTSNPGGSSRHESRQDRNSERRRELRAVAAETRRVLPSILRNLPRINAASSQALYLGTLPRLRAYDRPRRTYGRTTTIKIVNDDSFNAAINLAKSKGPASGRVAVLNMASHSSPGGGWLNGAMAQEEALCYRSSLSLSLHPHYYNFQQRMGVYTPDVVVIRSDMASGHRLWGPRVNGRDLPVFSVLSIAALRNPHTKRTQRTTRTGRLGYKEEYANSADRELTKDKMRLCLRMAAQKNHGLLVLGALGCGAFANPKEEVAYCWLEVLREQEFQGGWWEEIWFAVLDTRQEGNFEVFERVLGGKMV